jgi:hypothetical protein
MGIDWVRSNPSRQDRAVLSNKTGCHPGIQCSVLGHLSRYVGTTVLVHCNTIWVVLYQ